MKIKKNFSFFYLIVFTVLLLFGCAGGLSRKEAAKLYYNLGNAYLEIGKESRASEAYLKALEYDEKLKIASFNLAKAYMDSEKYLDALNMLDNMIKEDDTNNLLLSAKAYCLYRFGDIDSSYIIYEQILTLDPGNPEALYNTALIKAEQEDYEEAIERLTSLKSDKIDDEKLFTRINMAIGDIYVKMEKFEESIEYFEFVKNEESDNIKNLTLLFNSYYKSSYYSRALETGSDILEKTPDDLENNKEIFFDMAVIYLTIVEDSVKGLDYLEKALDAGFDNREKAENLATTEGLLDADDVISLLESKNLIDS